MSLSGQFEVEQKFAIDGESETFLQRLCELDAKPLGEVKQSDAYFNHPVRDFRETDEAMRIRSVGELNFLTWKGPKQQGVTKTRREIETPLGDGAVVAAQFGQVLEILGFRPVATVRKTRRRFELVRDEHQFEIAFDQVDGVGCFAEVELIVDQDQLAAAQAAVVGLAAECGLTRVERRSYLAMLLNQDE